MASNVDSTTQDMESNRIADRVTIPKASAAPEAEKTPSSKLDIPNWADNEDTVAKTLGYVHGYHKEFKSRGAWDKFITNCDTADELMRAAKNRTQLNADASANREATRSAVRSATFNVSARAIVAGESSVMLGNQEELPVEYEPLAGAWGTAEDEGLIQAQDKNAYLSWVMEKDKFREKVKQILLRAYKYGNQPLYMQWDYRKVWKKMKVPFKEVLNDKKAKKINTEPDELLSDKPASSKDMVFVNRLMTVADNPTIRWVDVKDCWYDSSINDDKEQLCVIMRQQKQIGEIWDLQRTNYFKNVGKIKMSHLYRGEGESEFKGDRQENADESNDSESPTGQFDLWWGWVLAPINSDGKWDPDNTIPTWHEYWFTGDLEANQVECLRLSPHWDTEIPWINVHAIDDDKGAIHMLPMELVVSLLAQEMTAFDQFVDNNTSRQEAPMILEPGAIRVRDLTYGPGGNRLYIKTPGMPNPDFVDVPDTTQQSLPMLKEVGERIRQALGTNKPFLGEPLGSRTSASEAITDFEQALKPALEDAKYKANQLMPFYATWVDRMRELFADPSSVIQITYEDKPREIKPANLWGPMKVRVVSVKKFQDNAIRERQEVAFLQQYFAVAAPLMGQRAIVPLKQIAKNRDYKDVDSWFPEDADDFDARHVAISENEAIVRRGVVDLPKPDENHVAHLKIHDPYLSSVVLLTEDDKIGLGITDQNVANFKIHIQQTKNLMEQGKAQSAQAGQAAAAVGQEPGLPGEAAGDEIAAQAGAEAQPPAGRPADIEGTGLLGG